MLKRNELHQTVDHHTTHSLLISIEFRLPYEFHTNLQGLN